MADPLVEALCLQGLGGVNGDVGAEGAAESEDGCAANDEADDEQDQADGPEPMRSAKHGVRMDFAVPGGYPDRDKDGGEHKQKRSAILHLATSAAGARHQLE
jgi:hypothetical protein